MTVRLAALGDVCTFVGGGTPSRKNPEYFDGDIPWATVKDFKHLTITSTEEHITEKAVRDSATNIVEQGSVLLVTRIGLGKVAIAGTRLAINQDIKAVRPSSNIEQDFLFWFLLARAEYIKSMGAGATVKGVTLSDIRAIQIPVPCLSEQRRIVDLVSHANGIVRLRRDAQRKAAELFPALFLDMFGDPATNPKGWPFVAFGELGQLDRGKSRHRPRDAQELYGGPYPFIQTGDVANSGGSITCHRQTYSDLGLAQSRLWPAGTLCITIAANIARTGVLGFDACFPDSVVGFTPSSRVLIPYIQQWLGFLQPTLEANAPQAAQKNINLDILRNLPVPVPPISLQRSFATKADALRSISAKQDSALEIAQATFDALLGQAFKH
jgi:type I restriction enzyme S subunit